MIKIANKLVGRAALLALALVVSACGGGGGGGSGVTAKLTLSSPVVYAGEVVTITWESRNADYCDAAGSWNGDLPPNGSQTYATSYVGDYYFVITCYNETSSAAASAALHASSGNGGPLISMSATNEAVPVGQSVTLTWNAPEATGCIASQGWDGAKPSQGQESVIVQSAGTNMYELSCTNSTGTSTFGVSVTGLLPTVTFSSDQDTVGAGQSATLNWSSEYADSCEASGEWSGNKATAGSESVPISSLGGHSYTLTCTNPGGSVSQTVAVTGAAPALFLQMYPVNVAAGKTVTVHWNGQYATGCSASGAWSGAKAASGFETFVMPEVGDKIFRMTCTNASGSDSNYVSTVVDARRDFPSATAFRMNEGHDGVVVTSTGAQTPLTTTPFWTRDLGAPASYPLIADGRVFVATANPDDSYGNQLFALNGQSGATLWGPVAVPGTYFGSGLTYENGRVFILNFDGDIRAYNAVNGSALWSTKLPGYWYSATPNAYGGLVFILGNGGLSAVDQATGEIRWTVGAASTTWSSPAVNSEGVYVTDDCQSHAFEPVTGQTIWQYAGQCGGAWSYTSPVRNNLYFARSDGAIDIIDTRSGIRQRQLASDTPVSVTDTLLIALNAGTLSATRLSDGAPVWTFSGDGQLSTAPVVVNDTVFVGSSSGTLFAVDLQTGEQTWTGLAPEPLISNNENGGPMPQSGAAAGENLLIFPTENSLVTWLFPE
ncbi:MAG: PQQ-binding-like beta-propeller repeat protein [Sinimarinibacterium sp.]|jgi:outer membrane protein assembly factor BamB